MNSNMTIVNHRLISSFSVIALNLVSHRNRSPTHNSCCESSLGTLDKSTLTWVYTGLSPETGNLARPETDLIKDPHPTRSVHKRTSLTRCPACYVHLCSSRVMTITLGSSTVRKGQSASEKKQTELDNYLNYHVSQHSPRDPVEMIINERQMLRFHETKS